MQGKELRLEKIHAQLWASFGRGAGMTFDLDCVDRAYSLGYAASVEKNLEDLWSNSSSLEETRNCAVRAGNLAAFLAKEDSKNL